MSWKKIVLSACASFIAAAGARAQWSDSLEAYADGSALEGQGGWQGWDGSNTIYSVVTSNLSLDGAQSLMLQPGADTVHAYTGYTTGHWVLRCDVYAPRAFRGRTLFLALNDYQDGGPYETSVQITFNGDTGMVQCPCGASTAVNVPLVLGQWAELRFEIDLDADLVEVYYDGALLRAYPWSSGVYGFSNFSELGIEAINLWPNTNSTPHVTELYFDAFELALPGGPIGTTYCFGDGSGTTCPCGNAGGPAEGCANSSGAGAALIGSGSTSAGADDLVCEAQRLIPSQPALLFSGLNATNGGMGQPFGDGLRCAGGGVQRLGVRIPDATGAASWGPGLGAIGGWVAGDTRRFQVWYRDPSGSPCGSAFNLSNGLEVTFVL